MASNRLLSLLFIHLALVRASSQPPLIAQPPFYFVLLFVFLQTFAVSLGRPLLTDQLETDSEIEPTTSYQDEHTTSSPPKLPGLPLKPDQDLTIGSGSGDISK